MRKLPASLIATAGILYGCGSSTRTDCVDLMGRTVPYNWCTTQPLPSVYAGYTPPFRYQTYRTGYGRSYYGPSYGGYYGGSSRGGFGGFSGGSSS